jgi:hypothetical protein
MKLRRLVDPQFQVALRKLAAQEVGLRSAFKLKGTLKRVTEALTTYDEVRSEALKRLGKTKEDGTLDVDATGNVQLESENLEAFTKEMNTLLDTDVEIGTLRGAELGDRVTLSTSELLSLEDLVTE